MSDYPLLSSTSQKWESHSERNRENLENLLKALLQCEVKGKDISSFLSALVSRVEKDGDISSLAVERMEDIQRKQHSVSRRRLGPWISGAKGRLDDSQGGLASIAAHLEHGKVSVEAFSAFIVAAQNNHAERMRRIALCREEVATLNSTIRQFQERIEAWDEI